MYTNKNSTIISRTIWRLFPCV